MSNLNEPTDGTTGEITDPGLVDRIRQRLDHDRNLVSLLQLIPALFWVLFFLGLALGIVVVYSLLETAPPQNALSLASFTFSNYAEFVATPFYVTVLLDSFVIALEVTVVGILIGYPVAYFLAFTDSPHRNFFLLLIILPFWINLVIRTYAWRLILGTQGVINYVLVDLLGIVTTPMNLLFSQQAVVLGLIHVFLPYIVIPIYSSLTRIDRSHVEAAKNLGANKLVAFWEVTLPQSIPGIAASVVMVFVLSFGSFLTPQLLGGTKHVMIANIIAQMFTSIRDWALGSAMAVVFVVLILVLVYLFNRMLGVDELYGGGA